MAFELIFAVVGAHHDGGTEDDPSDRGAHKDEDESSDVPNQAVNLPEIDVGIPKCKDSAEREALLLRELAEKPDGHTCQVKHRRVSEETRQREKQQLTSAPPAPYNRVRSRRKSRDCAGGRG